MCVYLWFNTLIPPFSLSCHGWVLSVCNPSSLMQMIRLYTNKTYPEKLPVWKHNEQQVFSISPVLTRWPSACHSIHHYRKEDGLKGERCDLSAANIAKWNRKMLFSNGFPAHLPLFGQTGFLPQIQATWLSQCLQSKVLKAPWGLDFRENQPTFICILNWICKFESFNLIKPAAPYYLIWMSEASKWSTWLKLNRNTCLHNLLFEWGNPVISKTARQTIKMTWTAP